jgi:hypothetical protein
VSLASAAWFFLFGFLRTAVALLLPPRAPCGRSHFGATHGPYPSLDPPGRVVVVAASAAAVVVVVLLLLLLCRYGTVRSFNLEHHTILFPLLAASVWSFTAAALEGALTGALQAFRVLLVGPAGAETHLERAALQLDDVRLRPAVVHNFLLLLHQLHGEPPATFAQVAELLARVPPEERVRRCLQRVVVDTSKDINEARRRSDIAGVRTHAQTAAQRRQAGGGGGASRTCASHVDSDSYSDDDDHHDDAAADGPAAAIVFRVLHCVRGGSLQRSPAAAIVFRVLHWARGGSLQVAPHSVRALMFTTSVLDTLPH